MDGSLRVSLVSPMKIPAALVVAGALAIGLAACGSGSGSNQSASSVKRGFFATRGTYLKVINQDLGVPSPDTITVTICAVNVRCKAPVTLGRSLETDPCYVNFGVVVSC